YSFVNREWTNRTGRKAEDAIGKTGPEVFPDQYQGLWESYEEQVVKSGEILQHEQVGMTTGRTYLTTKFLLRTAEGIPYTLCNSSLDITDRISAEQALRESEERFRRLSETAFEAIVITDQGKIVEVNNHFLEMFACERADLIAGSILNYVAPDSRELVQNHIQTGYEYPYEHNALKQDGIIFPVEVHGILVPYQGRNLRVTAIRDITERKQDEQRQLELALEKERSATFWILVSNIAHDIKTPLAIINTSLYLLEKHTSPVKRQEKIKNIKAQVHILSTFIQDLLAIARLDSEAGLKWVPVDVNELLMEIETDHRDSFEQKQLTFTLDLEESLLPIQADLSDLRRACTNLVENAINYTPEGGFV
ncbi:MAG: PAS domain S-box protein, partial [Anaerolineae bacterium]|nr:PAS domain S-box protein [Anaerolineae bacterium]